jgi:hypothetical protein
VGSFSGNAEHVDEILSGGQRRAVDGYGLGGWGVGSPHSGSTPLSDGQSFPVLRILEATRRPRVSSNRQRQFTNGILLRSRHAILVPPFAPRMLASVDLAKTEHSHPLGAAVPDNFATDFDLGGHSSLSRRRRKLDDDARPGIIGPSVGGDEHGRLPPARSTAPRRRRLAPAYRLRRAGPSQSRVRSAFA